jgi:hypothetical protein
MKDKLIQYRISSKDYDNVKAAAEDLRLTVAGYSRLSTIKSATNEV